MNRMDHANPEPAPSSSQPTTRQFPCESCGAKLEFHIGQQRLACPFCGYARDLGFGAGAKVEEQDLEATLSRLAARGQPTTELGALEVTCKGCGASVAFSGQFTTTECAFCGAAVQRDDAHRCPGRLHVDALIPFLVTQTQAQQQLSTWTQSLWFAPGEFKRRGVQGKFNGVYVPFWTYDAMTSCRYEGERGDDYTVTVGTGKNRRTETRTRWSHASGSFDRFFDDVIVPATTTFDQELLTELEPWPLDKAVPFNPEILAGKQALTYDIVLPAGFTRAQTIVRDTLEQDVRDRIGGDRQRVHALEVRYSALTYKHALFPVWMLAYRYREESYQVMINAITGEVSGQRPWSAWKIAGLTLALLLGLAWLLYLAR